SALVCRRSARADSNRSQLGGSCFSWRVTSHPTQAGRSPLASSGAARINNHAGLIWAIADLLRGDYKPSEYQRVVLPLVLLRRLDCVLEPTKQRVLDRLAKTKVQNVGPLLREITGSEV